jgi:hypothetical protein
MPDHKANKILFARIGWMSFYAGIGQGDERLIGGGSYNDHKVGSEQLNFAPYQARVYGYVQGVREAGIALERIDASAAELDALRNVLVIFVSRRPSQPGQVVVGWYRSGTVYREAPLDPRRQYRSVRSFNIEAARKDAVLLPTSQRWEPIPKGAGAFGQSNVCYPLNSDDTPKRARWMRTAVDYVLSYEGPNLVKDREAETEDQSAEQAERVAATAEGQGFASTPQQRRAIELHAMARAKTHYMGRFENVQDVSRTKGVLDLRCSSGSRLLRVEVKGTTGRGDSVILTHREVKRARSRGNHALYVLHSIKLNDTKATGGRERVFNKWDIRKGKLTPMSYTYELP